MREPPCGRARAPALPGTPCLCPAGPRALAARVPLGPLGPLEACCWEARGARWAVLGMRAAGGRLALQAAAAAAAAVAGGVFGLG